MCLDKVICIGNKGTFGFGFRLLEFAALVVDGGEGAESGDIWIDAEFLSRRKRDMLD